jgi:hypothetical protein
MILNSLSPRIASWANANVFWLVVILPLSLQEMERHGVRPFV